MGEDGEFITFSDPERPGQGLVAMASIPHSTVWTEEKGLKSKKPEIKVSIRKKPKPEEEILKSHFPLPDEPTWETLQRALGMARGRIIEVFENSRDKISGTIEIEGYHYSFEDKRPRKWRKFVPLSRFQKNHKEIQFTFWPTLTRRALQQMDASIPPVIYISHLRKNVRKSGLVEVIGKIVEKDLDSFIIGFNSLLQGRQYFVRLHGSITGCVGEQIQVQASLQNGRIQFQNHVSLKSLPL